MKQMFRLVLLLLLLDLSTANFERSLVDKSLRSVSNLRQISVHEIPSVTEGTEKLQVVEGTSTHAKVPPVRTSNEQLRWPLMIAMASVSLISFVLLAFARYFFSYDDAGGNRCCDSERLAYFLTVVQAANWSAMNVTFHIASQMGLTALEALFWRSITNFLVSTFIVLFSRGYFLPQKNRFWLLVRSLCSCGSAMGLYVAIVQMELVDAVALYALVPFFALFFQYVMLGEAPSRLLLCLVTVSFLGAMLVIQPFDLFAISSRDQVKLWSSLAAIGAASCSGFGSVVVNVFARDLSANIQVLWFGALGCVIAPLVMLLQGHLPHEVTLKKMTDPENGNIITIAILVIGASSFLMQWAAGWSLQLHRAGHLTTVGQSAELTMQWAVGIFILNEALDPWRCLGVIIVLICGVLVVTNIQCSPPSTCVDQRTKTDAEIQAAAKDESEVDSNHEFPTPGRQENSRPARTTTDDTDG